MKRRAADVVNRPKKRARADALGFWNESSAKWSKMLPIPDRVLDEWTPTSSRLGRNSWFDVQMHGVESSCVSSAVAIKVAPPKAAEELYRARKLRLHPSREQKRILDQWFGTVRFCYNKLVEANDRVGSGGVNLASMRSVIKEAHAQHEWLNEIPREVKDVAVRDMHKARNAHFAKPESKRYAKFKFRSKKDIQQSFDVQARDMKRKRGMFACLAIDKLFGAEKFPDSLDGAVRFLKDRLGRYYVVVPRKVKRDDNQVSPKVVALDPGVRTFQTTYDAHGLSAEWGKGGMSTIFVLCRRADKLQSSMSKKKGSKKRGCRREWWRALDKIKNKVKEIHHKTAKWLCDNYSVILIPKFEVSQMVKASNRKISSKVSRNMLTWAHFRFREFLKSKAQLCAGVSVVEVSEAFTSKTCGKCGELHHALGKNKTFECPRCSYTADRDVNGARNILLRHLSLHCEVEG